jgi:hypothetical protein
VIPFGEFVNAVVAFVLVAAAIYYFVVLPVNALMARAKRCELGDPMTKPLDPDAMPSRNRAAEARVSTPHYTSNRDLLFAIYWSEFGDAPTRQLLQQTGRGQKSR